MKNDSKKTQTRARLVVKKANELITAQYRLPLVQQRLLLLLISQIEPKKAITAEDWFYVDVELYAQVFDLDINGAYKSVGKAVHDLAEQWALLEDTEGQRTEVRWIGAKRYLKRSGRVGVKFNSDMIPYISDLHGRFTQYELRHIGQMRSAWGIPFYELLSRWRNKTMQYFPLEALREKFMLQDKYPNWRDFKRFVIEYAMTDLNTPRSEFDVSWEPVYGGNKVIGINVHYKPKKTVVEERKKIESEKQASRKSKSKNPQPAPSQPQQPHAWEKYGYLLPGEWADALRLSKEIDFDVTSYEEYQMAKEKEKRGATKKKKTGGQKTLF
ncbi:replication initiation protein [Marinobacter sp. F3R08]|uniref:replication initiation protein n=1 Tax=Marinobacter sp. F3R08 TaxID=2841559 RepID=UPI001C08F15F|nr:replication initiation protein [Marinobacter sp. F3R08]MBU2952226.1 replication initiation protein [Marinobacter sp. F3R08]